MSDPHRHRSILAHFVFWPGLVYGLMIQFLLFPSIWRLVSMPGFLSWQWPEKIWSYVSVWNLVLIISDYVVATTMLFLVLGYWSMQRHAMLAYSIMFVVHLFLSWLIMFELSNQTNWFDSDSLLSPILLLIYCSLAIYVACSGTVSKARG